MNAAKVDATEGEIVDQLFRFERRQFRQKLTLRRLRSRWKWVHLGHDGQQYED